MAFGRSTTTRPRSWRGAAALGTALGVLLLAVAPGSASAASSPPAQPAPPPGAPSTVTWTGTITAPTTTTPGASCPAQAQLVDSTDVTINVPTGFYDTTKMRADWSLDWSDPTSVNDEKLTVVPPAGGGAAKSSDNLNTLGEPGESVFFDNPVGGVWTVRACAFSSAPQSYTGKLVLTSTALSGGTSPTPTATATATATASAGPPSDRTFDAPVIVDGDELNSVAEPSLEVATDGAIYVSGPQGSGGVRVPAVVPGTGTVPGLGGDLVWRSDDNGKTFKFLGSFDGALGGGDADVVTSPNGSVYASGLFGTATGNCITVANSADKGESWAPNAAGCVDGAGVTDRQWNDVDGNAAVYTGYGTLSQGLVMHKSVITGPVLVNGPTTVVNSGDYQWPGVVDVNPVNGNAVMAWNTSSNDVIQINGVTRAGGLMFPNSKTVATAGGDTFDSFVGIDHGTDGTLYAVWTERHATLKETWTMLAASKNGGNTWGAPVHVDSTPRTTVFPWVTAGSAGRVAVSYYGTDSKGVSPENIDDKSAGWDVWSSFSTDYGQTYAEHRTTPEALHHGDICTSGTGCASGTRNLLDFFETDVDSYGCLLTAYTDDNAAATRVGFIRQTGGEGLLEGRTCIVALGPFIPEAPIAALLPVVAALLVGAVVYRRRQLTRG